jgi:hypothetical protein
MSKPMTVSKAEAQLNKARDCLEQAILANLDAEARQRKYTKMEMLVWSTNCHRGDREVTPSKKISLLLELYAEEVHRSGLIGIWTAERGWN